MNVRATLLPCICLMALAGGVARAQRLRDIPGRLDPLHVPKPDGNTIVLWRFENGVAKDSTVLKNHGKVRGGPRLDADGKHGRSLALSGGADSLFIMEMQGFSQAQLREGSLGLCFDFWCRVNERPRATQCLLDVATSAHEPAVRLELDTEGRLVISGYALPKNMSEEPVPQRAWFHIVVRSRNTYQPNRVYGDKAGVEVLVNGFPAVRTYTTERYYSFPPANTEGTFVLGNALSFKAGFKGRIDEFRVSNTRRHYYRLIGQAWLDPEKERPIERSTKYFRSPGSLIFQASFDEQEERDRVKPPADPRLAKTSAGPSQPVTAAAGIDVDIDDAGDEADLEKALGVDEIEPLERTSGVRGDALIVRGGQATLALPKDADFTEGTLEFWIRPGNWDNLTVPPGKHANFGYRDSSVHLLTLYGVPREGQGDPQALVSVRGYRLEGKLIVSEEFEKYYPNEPDVIIEPYQWTHVLLYWGRKVQHYQPRLYFEGHHVGWGIRHRIAKRAEWKVWDKYRPAFIKFGNNMETALDELRVYPYPFIPEEIDNSIAEYKGQEMREVGAATVSCEFRYSIGQMIVSVALSLLDVKEVDRAEVEFHLPQAGRTVKDTITDLEGGTGNVTLEVGMLPEGDYPVRGAVLDKAGRKLGTFESTFTRRPLPWLNNKFGILDTPPDPFEPVVVEKNRVSIVLRDHVVANDGNFSSVTVKGQQILAAPIHFEVQTGDAATKLTPKGPVEFGECNKVEAGWTATAAGQGLAIRSAAKLEYDGMTKYELVVEPSAGAVTVDRLSLEVPLKKEYAELYHVLPIGGNMRGYETAGYLPFNQGLTWDSKTWSGKKSVTKRPVGNFVAMVWLGGVIRGLCWFADNDEGWVPNDSQPALTVTREGDVVTLGVHFISEPFTLKEPRRIVYGFMATPPKPLHKHYRNWGRGNLAKYGPVAGRITSCDAFAPWVCPVKEHCMNFWPLGYDWDFAKMASNRQRNCDHGKYPPGQALMLYHDKRFVPHGRDAEYFRWEWHRKGQGAWPQSKIDCLAWHMEQWFGRNIMDGTYIDDTFPIADYNWETGSAYKLPDGRVQPGATHFTYRRYLKRVYSILHSHGKPPIITSHMSCALVWPFHSFFTVIYDGEGVGRFRSLTTTFLDAWALDRLMTLDVAERTGLVTRVMLKSEYAERGKDEDAWAHMIWRTNRSAVAAWLLFDMNMGAGGLGAVMTPYYEEDVTVLPFWKNQHIVSVKPLEKPVTDEKLLPKRGFWRNRDFRRSIGTQPFRVTLYKKPDRALVVVVNFLKATVDAHVEIDLDALGIPKDRQAAVRAVDVDTWKEPEGIDIQRAKKPTVEGSNVAISPEEDVGGDEISVEDELGLTKKKPTFGYKDGTLSATIKDHNFRVFELRWRQEKIQTGEQRRQRGRVGRSLDMAYDCT